MVVEVVTEVRIRLRGSVFVALVSFNRSLGSTTSSPGAVHSADVQQRATVA